MAKDKVIVLCSGGLNSAVVASIAAVDHRPALLHARVGHRTSERELDFFNKLANHLDVTDRLIVDLPYFAEVSGSARFGRKRPIEDAMAIGEGPSNCHIPGLIGALLSAAYTWAWAIDAPAVYVGISENLGSPAPRTNRIYPDFAREYLHLSGHLYDVASKGRSIALEAPLVDLCRADIIRLGKRMKTPFELTWSCVASDETPCGRCVGCATRSRGFLDAALPDPIMMQETPPVGDRGRAAAGVPAT